MIVVEDWAIYPGYMPGLPDVVLLRRPATLRSGSLLDGQYAVQVCETPEELLLVKEWARQPAAVRDLGNGRQGIDLRGPLGQARDEPTVWLAGYMPPRPGWPWLAVSRLPRPTSGYARGHYGIDSFTAETKWMDHLSRLRRRAPGCPVRVPDQRTRS